MSLGLLSGPSTRMGHAQAPRPSICGRPTSTWTGVRVPLGATSTSFKLATGSFHDVQDVAVGLTTKAKPRGQRYERTKIRSGKPGRLPRVGFSAWLCVLPSRTNISGSGADDTCSAERRRPIPTGRISEVRGWHGAIL